MELKVRVRSKMADNRHYASAANVIIRQARVKLAVIKVQRQRAIKLEILRQKATLEIQSAVKIQSVVRGIKGRELFVKKLREKKGIFVCSFVPEVVVVAVVVVNVCLLRQCHCSTLQ